MKVFRLPADFGRSLVGVKVLALTGGYCYNWLVAFSPLHGPAWLFWLSWLVILAANIALFIYYANRPERQEKQYLISLALDLIAVTYLFFAHPSTLVLMLVGLAMICGFSAFALPRSSAVLVGFVSMILFVSALLFGSIAPVEDKLELQTAVALLFVGAGALGAVLMLALRVKREVDEIYHVTDDLALDLSSHAVEAAISVDALVQRNREVQTLLQILQNIVSILDWDELFENIIAAFRHRFEFDKFCIYLLDAEKNQLQLEVDSGAERATGVSSAVKPDQGVVGWCFSHGKGILVDDVRKDERYTQFNERGRRIRTLACQPLEFRGERLGVLCLDSEKVGTIGQNDFSFLGNLAPLISIAVSNSLSYSMVKAESHTDNLTGLNNHRGFIEKFLPLLETSMCDEVPLALMMIDIDHFKKINDTYGHLVGNVILTELAKLLTGFFRTSDLVARYGGEEFVIVLNGTPADIAPRIAEQLRRKMEAYQFPISMQRDAFKQVTLSLGLATTSDTNLKAEIVRGSRGRDESDVYLRNVNEIAEQIIDNADKALYAAKREGRNQVMLSYYYPISPPGISEAMAGPER